MKRAAPVFDIKIGAYNLVSRTAAAYGRESSFIFSQTGEGAAGLGRQRGSLAGRGGGAYEGCSEEDMGNSLEPFIVIGQF